MIRQIVRPVVAFAAVAVIALAAQPAQAASLSPSVSCSGSIHTAVTTSGVSVTGSATCDGLATLVLTTAVDAGGVLSTATSLLPALPNLPVPVNASIPAVGVTAACSALLRAGTAVAVASSCSGTT